MPTGDISLQPYRGADDRDDNAGPAADEADGIENRQQIKDRERELVTGCVINNANNRDQTADGGEMEQSGKPAEKFNHGGLCVDSCTRRALPPCTEQARISSVHAPRRIHARPPSVYKPGGFFVRAIVADLFRIGRIRRVIMHEASLMRPA